MDGAKKLGTFVEFEKEMSTDNQAIGKNRQVLRKLMEKPGMNSERLEKLSYSDLIEARNS